MQFTVKTGPNRGRVLKPVRYLDGSFVASRVNLKSEYARTKSFATLESLARQGMRVRMGAEGIAPYLVRPD